MKNIKLIKIFLNQFGHKRYRHRLDMGWTNVHPADK